MELSIVIPVRDEAGNVAPLVAEIRRALADSTRYEIVFVDDGSVDGTADELASLAHAPDSIVRVITHSVPLGQSTALLTGARAAGGRWLAMLDGDGQNDPADLPAMLAVAASAAEARRHWLVIGHRVRRRDDWLRRVSSRIANRVRDWVLHDGTPDTGCGLKIMPTDSFLSLPYFDHMHRFIPALVRRQGGTVQSVPVNHRPRRAGHAKYGVNDRLWAGLVDLAGVAWLLRRNRLDS